MHRLNNAWEVWPLNTALIIVQHNHTHEGVHCYMNVSKEVKVEGRDPIGCQPWGRCHAWPGGEKTDPMGRAKARARPRLVAGDSLGPRRFHFTPRISKAGVCGGLEGFQKGADCSFGSSVVSPACKSDSPCVRVHMRMRLSARGRSPCLRRGGSASGCHGELSGTQVLWVQNDRTYWEPNLWVGTAGICILANALFLSFTLTVFSLKKKNVVKGLTHYCVIFFKNIP